MVIVNAGDARTMEALRSEENPMAGEKVSTTKVSGVASQDEKTMLRHGYSNQINANMRWII